MNEFTRDEICRESHLHDGAVGHEPHQHPVGARTDVIWDFVAAQSAQQRTVKLQTVTDLYVIVGAVVMVLHLQNKLMN